LPVASEDFRESDGVFWRASVDGGWGANIGFGRTSTLELY